jgi:predicted nucleic acid-binding protein
LSTASSEVPRRLVLDAGPLIALFYRPDSQHPAAQLGFHQLNRAGARPIVPLPIVFEVYKWLNYDASLPVAQLALARIRETLEVAYPGSIELRDVVGVLAAMPAWGGSLEDALVALTALKLDVPVWTFNYRDFAAFRNLHFWTPAPA